jgi:hypothetical protein
MKPLSLYGIIGHAGRRRRRYNRFDKEVGTNPELEQWLYFTSPLGNYRRYSKQPSFNNIATLSTVFPYPNILSILPRASTYFLASVKKRSG